MNPERTSGSSRMSDEEKLLARLHESINRSGLDPSSTLDLVAAWLEREFGDNAQVDDLTAARFRRRIEDPWPDGLGMPMERFLTVVTDDEQFPHRYERLGTYDPAVAERMGRMRQRVARLAPGTSAKHGEVGRGRVRERNTHSNSETVRRTSRRLNRDRPDLAEKVARREISANAAAIEAGYRTKKVNLRLDDAHRAAQVIVRYAEPEFIEALIRELSDALGEAP